MAVREIPGDYPEIILSRAKRRFKNSLKEREIAVAALPYRGKIRPMALVTELRGENFYVVTIFPLTEREIARRIQNKRWTPL